MSPWSAFSACDINNDRTLETYEMEKLIWLHDKHRPLVSRVHREMKIIDEDNSGTIDRLEWLMYLVAPDPNEGLGDQYDLNLREIFDKFDAFD